MKKNGAQIVIEALLAHGVDTVFGYPGGNILPLYDELRKNRKSIKHILCAHEQGVAHASDGYARASGKCGVCFATSGPGATNLVTGIATAYMDSTPVVFITANADLALIGRDAFQEADITGITIPITKGNFMVSEVNELADTLEKAFCIARSGRPGPVLVDIPHDVLCAKCDFDKINVIPFETVKISGNLAHAEGTILASDKPILLLGGGTKGKRHAVLSFVNKFKCPIVCTMMGLNTLPYDTENYYGMIGEFGNDCANEALNDSDLIIAVGVRFSDRILQKGFIGKKIIHIDIDRAEIGKNITPDIAIEGDAAQVLCKLNCTREKTWFNKERKASSVLFDKLSKAFDDAIIVTEVGEHQVRTAREFKLSKDNLLITPGGFGTMGFGLGAAIGAAIANPGRRILHLAGDGSFRMNFHELATVAANKLPITTVLFDNEKLAMVERWQKSDFAGRTYSSDLSQGVDYLALARAFGIKSQELPADFTELKPGLYRIKEK